MSTKILSTIVLEQGKFRVRKTRGKTKNTVNAIEIGEMGGSDARLCFSHQTRFNSRIGMRSCLRLRTNGRIYLGRKRRRG